MSLAKREKKITERFYCALRDIERCLQELNRRADFGLPDGPNLAADTLIAALGFVGDQKGADRAQILQQLQDFIACDLRRPKAAQFVQFAEMSAKIQESGRFDIGIYDAESYEALIFTIEAARCMCAGRFGDETALKLLKMAVQRMEQVCVQE